MKKTKQIFVTTLLIIFIASCASQTRGVLHFDAKYKEVFYASVKAISETNYAVVSADVATGFIVAKLGGIAGSDAVVTMSVTVKKRALGTDVEVAIIPIPGAIQFSGRGTEEQFDDFKILLRRKFSSIKGAN